MKKALSVLCAAMLLFPLCACRTAAPEPASATSIPLGTPAPTDEPAAASDTAPILSPGASTVSALSDLFAAGPDGTLYTCLVRADGLVCVYDILPEDIGCVAGIIVTDDGIYAAVKDSYYSLDPAALYLFPADGGAARLLAESVLPGGIFCLAGDRLFYTDYTDATLRCVDLSTGEDMSAADQYTYLLGASGGFLYYAADGIIYRSDSTLGAAVEMFPDNGTGRIHADANGLYDIVYADDGGGTVAELRAPDGTLRSTVTLPDTADRCVFADGALYVPQPSSQTIAVVDTLSGDTREISFAELGYYFAIRFAASDAVYIETILDGVDQVCRIGRDGTGAEILGEPIIY